MTDRNQEAVTDEILEQNVAQLLSRAHEPPQMSAEGRARVLHNLKVRQRQRRDDRAPQAGLWGWLQARQNLVASTAVAAIAVTVFTVSHRASQHHPAVHANQSAVPEQVRLVDGSELILNRDAEVTVLGERHIRIDSGEVIVDVVKGGGNFIVESAHGRVVVLGTRFVIKTDLEETWTAVMRGRVRIENQAGRELLRPGEQGTLRDGQMPTRRAAPRLSHLTSWAKLARRQDEGQSKRPARRGTLLARNPRWQTQEFPLPMRDLIVDVHVDNQVARVTLDQTFFNPQQQQLEGVYRFALPPGAAISRQAMYVDGRLMESAIVERQRGRHIYEEIVYTNRDPALLEWMAGNLFKVRIFPLPARTEKRILISYTQSLERLYDDYRLEVPIPAVDNAVDSVRYNVRLADCPDCTVKSTSHDIAVTREGQDTMVSFTAEGYELGDDLLLTIRDPATKPRVAAHGRGDKRYFMARVKPDIKAAPGAHSAAAQRRWVILHDTSASRTALDRKAQAYLIDHFLREIDEDDEVNLLAFDTRVRQLSPSFITAGKVSRLAVANFLSEQSADGVGYTDLENVLAAALRLLGAAADDRAPHILYLGDGIVTGGERRISALRELVAGKATFIGVGVGERVDPHLLGTLAAATGGHFTTMNSGDDLEWRVFDMVAALNTPRLVDVEAVLVDGEGERLADAEVYTSSSQLADGEELSIVARLAKSAPATLVMRGKLGGQAWSQRVDLTAIEADRDAGYLPRLWARRRVDALIAGDASEHKEEITALGTEHFLVTPFTSLIVLENDRMYKTFKVERDRKPGWAAYPAPAKIEVVHEPLDSAVVPADVALDAVMLRTPLQVLQRQGGYGNVGMGHMTVVTSPGFSQDAIFLDGSISVTTALAGGGGVRLGTIAGADLSSNRERAGDVGGESTPRPDEEAQDEDEDKSILDDVSAQVVSTESLQRQPSSWSARVGGRSAGGLLKNVEQSARTKSDRADSFAFAGKGKGRATGAYSRLVRDKARGPRRAELTTRRGRSRGQGRGGYYGSYNSTPVPTAYHYATDPRFFDLTEFVPGFFADAYDVDRRDLEEASAGLRGSISAEARALIDQAHAARRATRYDFADGDVLTVDERGHLRLSRELDSGLDEELVFTGVHLYRLYPELGLAIRRDGAGAAPLVHARWAPFVLSDADALARWYQVTLAGPRTLRLGLGGDAAVEVVLDSALRIAEVAVVVGDQRSVELSVAHRNGEMVLTRGKKVELVRLSSAPGSAHRVTEGDWTVAEMPLRQPAYWNGERKDQQVGSSEWRYATRQLLASYAALGDAAELWKEIAALTEAGAPTRGEVVLASRGFVRAGGSDKIDTVLAAFTDDSVADYLRASFSYARKPREAAFDGVAKRSAGTLVGMLASYRGVLAAMYNWTEASRRKTKRRFDDFAASYSNPTFAYIVAQQFGSRWSWQAPKETAAIWDTVVAAATGKGPWPAIAGYESARALYNAGRYDAAAERFERLLANSDSEYLPAIDQTVVWAFKNSSRGHAGWRLFWNRWRESVLRDGDAEALYVLLRSALVSGENSDLERIAARVVEVEVSDPDMLIALIDMLQQSGRGDQAQVLLNQALASAKAPDPDLFERASRVAEQQGRVADAIDYLERAMAVYYADEAELSAIRADYGRLIGLYARRAQSAPGDQRSQLTGKALALAAEWRKVDPDNPDIDRRCAHMLYSLQRPEEAWRYLSTAIEKRPMEGEAFRVVADALENEGRVEQAEEVWQRAAAVEPGNPTWILRRANALFALGKTEPALALVEEILTAEEWHSRFNGIVYQARAIKQRHAQQSAE